MTIDGKKKYVIHEDCAAVKNLVLNVLKIALMISFCVLVLSLTIILRSDSIKADKAVYFSASAEQADKSKSNNLQFPFDELATTSSNDDCIFHSDETCTTVSKGPHVEIFKY
uniref:Uncharacterized protein n=1 Tax=Panagrolaimus sp. PS1159 TaxID=55785 RepID=A0AC35GIS7_9BILA